MCKQKSPTIKLWLCTTLSKLYKLSSLALLTSSCQQKTVVLLRKGKSKVECEKTKIKAGHCRECMMCHGNCYLIGGLLVKNAAGQLVNNVLNQCLPLKREQIENVEERQKRRHWRTKGNSMTYVKWPTGRKRKWTTESDLQVSAHQALLILHLLLLQLDHYQQLVSPQQSQWPWRMSKEGASAKRQSWPARPGWPLPIASKGWLSERCNAVH